MDASTLQMLGMLTSVVGKVGGGIAEARAHQISAKATKEKAQYEEEKHRKELKYLMGRQRLLYAKAGVDPGAGSPLAFIAYTAAEGEREAAMIRIGGEAEAEKEKAKGRAALTKGLTGGISSFLTGMEKFYAKQG